jgi:hypothetical protein
LKKLKSSPANENITFERGDISSIEMANLASFYKHKQDSVGSTGSALLNKQQEDDLIREL